jgi:phosphoglycolate phosphatase
MDTRTIIFDFDGTLADSLPVVIEIAKDVGELSVTPEEIEAFRNMPPLEVIRSIGVPYYKIPGLLLKGRQLLSKRLNEVKIFPHMPEIIKNLHDADHDICLVSSNSESNVRSVLKTAGIEDYFDRIYANIGVFSKAAAIKKVVRKQRADKTKTIYVGDEVRDIEASKKSGVQIISVTWGYNGKKILSNYKPNYMADTPQDLIDIIFKNSL